MSTMNACARVCVTASLLLILVGCQQMSDMTGLGGSKYPAMCSIERLDREDTAMFVRVLVDDLRGLEVHQAGSNCHVNPFLWCCEFCVGYFE